MNMGIPKPLMKYAFDMSPSFRKPSCIEDTDTSSDRFPSRRPDLAQLEDVRKPVFVVCDFSHLRTVYPSLFGHLPPSPSFFSMGELGWSFLSLLVFWFFFSSLASLPGN